MLLVVWTCSPSHAGVTPSRSSSSLDVSPCCRCASCLPSPGAPAQSGVRGRPWPAAIGPAAAGLPARPRGVGIGAGPARGGQQGCWLWPRAVGCCLHAPRARSWACWGSQLAGPARGDGHFLQWLWRYVGTFDFLQVCQEAKVSLFFCSSYNICHKAMSGF